MRQLTISRLAASACLLTLLAPGLIAQETLEAEAQPAPDSRDVLFYRSAIAEVESNEGAYAQALQEQLLSLGLSLQQQGRHEEAIAVLKRGVHLARINDGLYSIDQIPLLQTEIASHMASGQFLEADERQMYLYRVQQRSLDRGEIRAQALMQQARWQRRAYDMGVGEQGFTRLLAMWDLYRLALNDVVAQEGDDSPSLLVPLDGMLQSQYLIAGYQAQSSGGGFDGDSLAVRQDQGRFNAYRSQSYKKGQAVIQAIYDIDQKNNGDDKIAAAEHLTMLGDWMLWHGERESAFSAYQDALMELAEAEDAQQEVDRLFGAPVALPSLAGVRPLPQPIASEQADLLLEFGISNRGRVIDLQRIEDDPDESTEDSESATNTEPVVDNEAVANRFMRKLRKTRFRPRFEDGEPVATEKIVWAYDTSNW
ncbi:MAG: hypothetical protein ABJK25_19400 [Halieaceae bacterium]